MAAASGSVGASFPTWTWHKGPVRKLRYEVIGNCPIFDYTADRVVALFRSAGFDDVLVTLMSASGLFAEATVREGA